MKKGTESGVFHLEGIPRDPILKRMERREIWRDRLRFRVLPIFMAGAAIVTVVAAPSILLRLLSEDYTIENMIAKLNDEKPLLVNEERYGPTEAVEDLVTVTNYPDTSQVLGLIPRGTKMDGSIRQDGKVVAYCGSIPGLNLSFNSADARKLCAIDYSAVALTKADKAEVSSPDTMAALIPVGIFKGSVLVTKKVKDESVQIGTSPKISERKLISWDNIISLAGVGVKDSNVFSVQNPLLVEGDNPTFDPGRYPSKWIPFRAKVLVNDYPRTVEEMVLYLNVSQQTIFPGYVQPDSPDWPDKIEPLKPDGIPLAGKFNIVNLHPVIKMGGITVETEDGGNLRVSPIPETVSAAR